MEVGLHQTSPPSAYTICEHCGTLINVFQLAELPAETLADLGAEVEYATDAFCTLATALPSALNNRIFNWNLLVGTFLFADTKVSTATKAFVSPCNFTEWRLIVESSAAQIPSTYLFTTVVTDSNPWAVNAQHLSATNSFTVVVNAIHNGPELPFQTNRTIAELTTLILTNTASDGDIPAHLLSYLLLDAPIGAAIDTNGVISWTPTEAQGPSTNILTTVVLDDGTPSLSATNSFMVVVEEINNVKSAAYDNPHFCAGGHIGPAGLSLRSNP